MRFINWDLSLADFKSADDAFSGKRAARVRKSIEILKGSPYRLEFHEMTDSLLDKFEALYNTFMTAKEGGIVYPVKEKIQANQAKGRKYHILALWNEDELVGGLVFSERKSSLSVAYRVYPIKLDLGMKSSPAQIAEYLIIDFALKHGKNKINHGRDRNAFGLNADIGLASFKMRTGATPFVSKNVNEKLELPSELDQDVLVCIGEKEGEICEELVLYTDLDKDEALEKYQIAKYTLVPIRVEKR